MTRNENMAKMYENGWLVIELARYFAVGNKVITAALKCEFGEERYSELKIKRYSKSKRGEKHPRFKNGLSVEGYARVTRYGKTQFVHQLVLMKHFGWDTWPKGLNTHHIDGDKTNNALNNLSLMTTSAHSRHHARERKIEKDKFMAGWAAARDKYRDG